MSSIKKDQVAQVSHRLDTHFDKGQLVKEFLGDQASEPLPVGNTFVGEDGKWRYGKGNDMQEGNVEPGHF